MSNNVVAHPHHDLMAEAAHERAVANSPEGQALQKAIFDAVFAYSDFLDHSGVIWGDNYRLKAQALVITVDYGADAGSSVDIHLKDGAVDRVYGNGANPDPDAKGPLDIPHKLRPDERGSE
jgi:hypothetical protein